MSTAEQVIAFSFGDVTLRVSAVSDIGPTRTLNEDSFLDEAPVFLVADGMGGHAHGDWASHKVVETFSSLISSGKVTSAAEVLNAIAESNAAVRALSAGSDDDAAVAGTTVSGVALVGTDDGSSLHWMVFNVGDSRVYAWDGQLTQLTVDHSAVQELLDRGQITEVEAARHPERNVITRAIGVDDEVEADVWLLPVGGTQFFLVCSDGLTKELPHDRLSAIFADAVADGDTGSLASVLVESAIEAGGLDNVTVLVVEASVASTGARAGNQSLADVMPAFLEQTLPRR